MPAHLPIDTIHAIRAVIRATALPAMVALSVRTGREPINTRATRPAKIVGDLGRQVRLVMGCAALSTMRRLRTRSDRGDDELLDAALDAGCVSFDTAAAYGGGASERALGRWIRSRRVRDHVTVITKGGHPETGGTGRLSAGALAEDLHGSLRRLRTDHVDLYLLHRDDESRPVGAIMSVLHRFVQQGKALSIGVSNWSHARIEAANRHASAVGITELSASSPHYSLAEMHEPPWPGCVSITGSTGVAARAWYEHTQMPVLAWSPLSGGYLAGKRLPPEHPGHASYGSAVNAARRRRLEHAAAALGSSPAQVAVAYLLADDLNVFPVVAASSPGRVRELFAAGDIALSPTQRDWLMLQTGAPGNPFG